ncbi:hypothetical protein HGRIS_012485 [Hohenbuehelia grisea]|uniref:Yeast cell wall synthesis Kre9/Knh1-like N-terminal domain-containing protein n=1 Tax=Hohenbuehelia grisea TaxID=104357 RepID=A0ABR3ISM0_9AGAR
MPLRQSHSRYSLFSSNLQLLVCSFLVFVLAANVNAELYVVDPTSGSTCRGGEDCTVTWLDDGTSPLLTAIGPCNVGLYTGNQQLVQQLGPVVVSSSRSLTFKVNPKAGPNSDRYYVAFVATTARLNNSDSPYIGFSPFFRLNNMSGSFASPLPSSSFATPSTRPSTTQLSTITVGRPSTPLASSSTASPTSASSKAASSASSALPTTTLTIPASSASSTSQTSSGFVTSASPSASSLSAPSPAPANSNAAGSVRLSSASLAMAFVTSGWLFLITSC